MMFERPGGSSRLTHFKLENINFITINKKANLSFV